MLIDYKENVKQWSKDCYMKKVSRAMLVNSMEIL